MQKIHKNLQQHRPHPINTRPLMFQKIKNRITHTISYEDQQKNTQSNASHHQDPTSIQLIKNLFSNNLDPHQSQRTNNHQQRQNSYSSVSSSKRLKLKDYLKLNQISRQKRTNSINNILAKGQKIKQIKSNASIQQKSSTGKVLQQSSSNNQLFTTFNPHQVSGQQSTIRKVQKNRYSFQQQIQIQKSHIIQLAKSTKQKLSQSIQMMSQANHKFTSYNDLVFLFRVQQLLNEYVLKGIQKINDGYIDQLKQKSEKKENQNENQQMNQTLKAIMDMSSTKKSLIIPKSPVARVHERLMQQKSTQKKQKQYKTINILPISTTLNFSKSSQQ